MSSKMLEADSIFHKILRRAVPCHLVYENEHVLAFLDVNPLSRGHTIVIPKERYGASPQRVDDLSPDTASALGDALVRITRAILAATKAEAYNVLSNNGILAGQTIGYPHLHIIPKYSDGTGLGSAPGVLEDGPALAAAIALKLRGI